METTANTKERRLKGRQQRWWSEMPLPDELMSSILSHLTFKELARTSLISRNWLGYWRQIPVLTFDNPALIHKMLHPKRFSKKFSVYWGRIYEGRCDFINWVDNVLDRHLGLIIDEFRVAFYLDYDHQTDIDRWVVWALSRNVQTLHLDFTKPNGTRILVDEEKHRYALGTPLLDHCLTTLKVLCLKSVNVSNQFVEKLFEICGRSLESLWIEKSEPLTSINIKSNGTHRLSLRHLTVRYCAELDTVDIEAPNLESFTYETYSTHEFKLFRIANASSLSRVLLHAPHEDHFFYVLRSLSRYFPQFVDLTLNWYLCSKTDTDPVVDYFPELTKLKHLTLYVHGSRDRNIAGWVPFIQACPLLEKLTMKCRLWFFPLPPKNIKQYKRQLIHLKTFEILEFIGRNVDVDVATFVLENATSLQEVVFQGLNVNIRDALRQLKLKIPEGVKVR